MEKEPVLISGCLLGLCCRYDGKSKPAEKAAALSEKYYLIPVCPEQLGGLPTPRVPSERRGERVVTRDGRDVTENYRLGARRALAIAQREGVSAAVLKERSPSCGRGEVYDGTFTGTLTPGDGVTAELFAASGLAVYGESDCIGTEDAPLLRHFP